MKKILIPIVIVLCLAGSGYGLWKYMDAGVLSSNQLPQKTTINGVDCSGLTTDEAKEALVKEWNFRSFTLPIFLSLLVK